MIKIAGGIYIKSSGLSAALMRAYPGVGLNRASQLAAHSRIRMQQQLKPKTGLTMIGAPAPKVTPGMVGEQLVTPKTLPESGELQ